MTSAFTRRELLGIGGGFAAAAAASVGGVVGLSGADLLDRRDPGGTDRVAAWTPADEEFAPSGVSGPYSVTYADLRVLRRVEASLDGRLRAVPHRWLTRLSTVTREDFETTDAYLRIGGRGVVQVHLAEYDRSRVAARLERTGYELATEVGGFEVYVQPSSNTRELRTIPHLDDAIAMDGHRLLSCGRPGLEDPAEPLVTAVRARRGGPRLVERDDAMRRLVSEVGDADLLTVAPAVREWVENGPRGVDGLRAHGRAVRFGERETTVRSVLLYESGATPDAAAVRSLFLGDGGSSVGVRPVDEFRVDLGANAAVVTARTPPSAFAEGAAGRQVDSTLAAYSSREME